MGKLLLGWFCRSCGGVIPLRILFFFSLGLLDVWIICSNAALFTLPRHHPSACNTLDTGNKDGSGGQQYLSAPQAKSQQRWCNIVGLAADQPSSLTLWDHK